MQIQLRKPKLTKFVAEKVRRGDYRSPEAVIENALTRMMDEERPLTREDIAAIQAADEEIDRGEYVDFDTFAKEMRRKYKIK